MDASGRNNPRLYVRLIFLAELVSVHSSAVDHDLSFHIERLRLRVEFVYALSTDDLTLIVFNKIEELNIIGQSGAFHSWDVIVYSCGEESVEVHATVVRLSFGHSGTIAFVKLLQLWVVLAKLTLGHKSGT